MLILGSNIEINLAVSPVVSDFFVGNSVQFWRQLNAHFWGQLPRATWAEVNPEAHFWMRSILEHLGKFSEAGPILGNSGLTSGQ